MGASATRGPTSRSRKTRAICEIPRRPDTRWHTRPRSSVRRETSPRALGFSYSPKWLMSGEPIGDIAPGRIVGGYAIQGHLGGSAWAETYVAAADSGDLVALKVVDASI